MRVARILPAEVPQGVVQGGVGARKKPERHFEGSPLRHLWHYVEDNVGNDSREGRDLREGRKKNKTEEKEQQKQRQPAATTKELS